MIARSVYLRKAGIYVLSLVVFFLGACARPPVREMSEAQRNLDEARVKEADVYASELYLKAEGSMKDARGFIAERKYEKARALAERVSKLAEQASVMAETVKAGQREETEKMVTEAEQGISSIRTWTLPRNTKGRFQKPQVSGEAELQAWENELTQIRAKLSEDKVGDARQSAERVLSEVAVRMKRLGVPEGTIQQKRRR
jgi:hypothetical protein